MVGIPPHVDNLTQFLLNVAHISVTESHASTVSGVSKSVPVATRSKVWVCGRSPTGFVGSNLTRGHGHLSVVSVVR